MPTYIFRDKNTQEEFEVVMRIAELDKFREENPHLETILQPASIGYSYNRKKPDDGFRDVLKEIRKEQPKADFNII